MFESGRPLADGRITGNDTDADAISFEPHYDVISAPNQVQIKDNRLLPGGFDKATASADIAVQSEAALDSDFVGGSDQATYVVDMQGRPMPLIVSAQLLYQPVSYSFVTDLRRNSPLVQRFARYYDGADKSPALLASVQHVVP